MNKYNIQDLTLSFLCDMILLGKIELSEVPAEIRLSDKSLYIVAFRRARDISIYEYEKVLSILKSDIDTALENESKHWLIFYDDMKEDMERSLNEIY